MNDNKEVHVYIADDEIASNFKYDFYCFATIGNEWAGDCYRKNGGKFDMLCIKGERPQRMHFANPEEAYKTFEALLNASRI
jgi:hypothetical protein